MGAGHGQEKARGGCGMPWRGTDPSERRAPRGQAPWPAPALVCQGPSRLRGQGRPQAVAQRPLMPEVWPRNLRGASPGCGVTPRAGWVPRACSSRPGQEASGRLNAPPRNGYRSAARQLRPTPLPCNVTRPPQPSASPRSCRKTTNSVSCGRLGRGHRQSFRSAGENRCGSDRSMGAEELPHRRRCTRTAGIDERPARGTTRPGMTQAVDDPHLQDLAPSHVPAIHLVPTTCPG